MNIYYWNKRKNFGDQLTSLLLHRFSHLDSHYTNPENAELVMVGSIMEHLPKNWEGIIAGIGKLHEKTNINHLPNAKILALRGPLSAQGLTSNKNIILADPGLIADELVGPQERIYDLGLVPHWTDTKLENDPRFKKYNPKIIRVENDPLKVITEIGQCKKIVSSSLHGIITADAFGIPRRIEIASRILSHPHQEGGLFKWQDYSASLGVKLEIGVTSEIKRTIIIDKQHELFDLFEELRAIFSS